MKRIECPACGGTILGDRYRGLDGSQWCKSCGTHARQEIAENYASEELAVVDVHRLVLDRLWQATEEDTPGWLK